jgi:hypothetical protein
VRCTLDHLNVSQLTLSAHHRMSLIDDARWMWLMMQLHQMRPTAQPYMARNEQTGPSET